MWDVKKIQSRRVSILQLFYAVAKHETQTNYERRHNKRMHTDREFAIEKICLGNSNKVEDIQSDKKWDLFKVLWSPG